MWTRQGGDTDREQTGRAKAETKTKIATNLYETRTDGKDKQ